MSVRSVPRGFRTSTATLVCDAQRLLSALQEKSIGVPVANRLSPHFIAEFESGIAGVMRLQSLQSGANGTLGSLVQEKSVAKADVVHLCHVARRAAALAFAGESTLLRGEFQVGARGSRAIADRLERAKAILAACERHAVVMAEFGWIPATTAQLSASIATLADVDRTRESTADGKLRLTAERLASANRLYRQCLAIQNAARLVYDGPDRREDPVAIEARARFLVGEFPRRRSRPNKSATSVPPTIAAPTEPLAVVDAIESQAPDRTERQNERRHEKQATVEAPWAPADVPSLAPPLVSVESLSRPEAFIRRWFVLRRPRLLRVPSVVGRDSG